jgi:DNA-3-methyladenine glycosylase I
MSYCKAIPRIPGANRKYHQDYHDHQYGFPIHDDDELFARLILEINQAGLSWETILKRQEGFRKSYHQFRISKVVSYSEKDRERLMNDAGIIRNRLKINAAIENAKTISHLQKKHGSFERWIELQHPLSKEEWVKLFKKTFRFTGGEIVGEFLMSIGVLPGAHDKDCAIFNKVAEEKPLWMLKVRTDKSK